MTCLKHELWANFSASIGRSRHICWPVKIMDRLVSGSPGLTVTVCHVPFCAIDGSSGMGKFSFVLRVHPGHVPPTGSHWETWLGEGRYMTGGDVEPGLWSPNTSSKMYVGMKVKHKRWACFVVWAKLAGTYILARVQISLTTFDSQKYRYEKWLFIAQLNWGIVGIHQPKKIQGDVYQLSITCEFSPHVTRMQISSSSSMQC